MGECGMSDLSTSSGAGQDPAAGHALGRPVDVLVLGAGSRGAGYAAITADVPDLGRVVGVADPNPVRRQRFAEQHGLDPARVFASWQDALAVPKFADLAIVATQDADHVSPAIAAAEAGYHLLLEKPIAPTEAETRKVVAAVKATGVMFGVCHVLRYTPHTVQLKALLDDGAIGDVISVEHLEPVGWWHMAHSFVRGNWGNEERSSPMLLAKSCHDLDWLLHIVDRRCERVASFGSLTHFTRAHQPEGAADRCLECPVQIESVCPYSAKRIYLTALKQNPGGWPVNVITDDQTESGVLAALREGPYGECVYATDNDVVDHQVVAMEFEGGVTVSFTMTGFTGSRSRNTRIFGSHGEITTDSGVITIEDFRNGEVRRIDTTAGTEGTIRSGHGGGDEGLMLAMLRAVQQGRRDLILSDADSSLESHLMVFTAEKARHRGTVERVVLS